MVGRVVGSWVGSRVGRVVGVVVGGVVGEPLGALVGACEAEKPEAWSRVRGHTRLNIINSTASIEEPS